MVELTSEENLEIFKSEIAERNMFCHLINSICTHHRVADVTCHVFYSCLQGSRYCT